MKKNIYLRRITVGIIVIIALFALVKFNSKTRIISRNEAVENVKTLSEVKDYLKTVPQAQVSVSGEENNLYFVQVYEIKNGHTATFNWYQVDKTTGEAKKEF